MYLKTSRNISLRFHLNSEVNASKFQENIYLYYVHIDKGYGESSKQWVIKLLIDSINNNNTMVK